MRYVLAGFDGSERSRVAVVHAAQVAERCCARLHVLMVAGLPSTGMDIAVGDDVIEECIAAVTGQLLTLSSELALKDAQYTFRIGEPAREIVRYAREFDVRHVVLGRPRAVVPRIMSTAWRVERLLAGTGCEVMIVTGQTTLSAGRVLTPELSARRGNIR
ncbi:universal stress protein [Paraburkholderia sp.]|uniref:universal stress protein n=1 Tax=Paraburkholderia sp. TaxID=1926495 RepID=UPI0039E6F5F2